MMQENIGSIYKQPNELNEIIKTVRIVIDFVVSSGCPKDKRILDYVHNVLKMNNIVELNKHVNIQPD